MVAVATPLLAAFYLLAASPPENKGRQRYAPKRGRKSRKSGGGARQQQQQREDTLPPPPPPTDPHGPFPTYFTCRHSYEDTLMEELLLENESLQVSSPYPGLVRVQHDNNKNDDADDSLILDPVYALQVLPNCRIIQVSNSIKGLARSIADIGEFQSLLQEHPTRGSLVVHALVPGMCKGQREPKLQRRAHLIADAIVEMWKKRFSAARKSTTTTSQVDATNLLLLQVLLLSPDVVAASLAPCRRHVQDDLDAGGIMPWPNPHLPLGLAQVDIDTKMPSSAYRKLLEAFACWNGIVPHRCDTVVDLGASPGGWTYAVLLHCQPKHIIAVDRAELDPTLIRKHASIEFVQGDAFTYQPPFSVDFMMSDIIAYPERIVELLETWCSRQLARNMIVTLKFQGTTPSWNAINKSLDVARSNGYCARAKHFFNNKNEVTLMLQHESVQGSDIDCTMQIRGPIYERAWPKGD